jgi:hypothetical protein
MFHVILPVSKKESIKSLFFSLFSINHSIKKPDLVIVCFDGALELYDHFALIRANEFNNLNIESILFEKSIGLSDVLANVLDIYPSSYFARVDCGDFVFKHRFKLQFEKLESNDNAFCIAGNMAFKVMGKRYYKHCIDNEFNQMTLLFKNVLTHSSLLVRTSLYVKMGGYNKNLSSSQDYDLYRKSLFLGYDILFLNELIGCKTFNLTGTTFSKPKQQIVNTLKILIEYFDIKNQLMSQLFYILFYFLLSLVPEFFLVHLKRRKHAY